MRTLSTLSDADLIGLLPKQKEAFDVLFIRYKNDLRNVVAHYINDKHQAEDMVQDAFLKIYLSLKAGKYNDEGKFLPWALRIAHNLCMDYLRKTKQRVAPLPDDKTVAADWFTHNTAETNIIKREQRNKLMRLIEKLSTEQKQLVRYRYYEDMSFKEISGLMNTSVNTSLGRMRYALGHLKKHVAVNPVFW